MHCNRCGNPILSDAHFCTVCGAPLDSPPKKKKPVWPWILAVVLVVIVVGFVLFGVLFFQLFRFMGRESARYNQVQNYLNAVFEADADAILDQIPAQVLSEMQEDHDVSRSELEESLTVYLRSRPLELEQLYYYETFTFEDTNTSEFMDAVPFLQAYGLSAEKYWDVKVICKTPGQSSNFSYKMCLAKIDGEYYLMEPMYLVEQILEQEDQETQDGWKSNTPASAKDVTEFFNSGSCGGFV